MQRGTPTARRLVGRADRWRGAWLALAGFALDRVVKFLASPAAGGGVVAVARSLNEAGPLSVPLPPAAAAALAGGVLLVVLVAWSRARRAGQRCQAAALGFVVVGGVSNLADRALYGGVVDMFHLTLWGTMSFNLADVYVAAGVAGYLACARHELASGARRV